MIDEFLYDYAMRFIGTPYKWGGDDPISGFDCSGLVIELLQCWGKFPHGQDTTAQGLYLYYKNKKCYECTYPKFGRLAFYGKDVNHIIHISFCISANHCIDAGGGGPKTKTIQDAIDHNAYVRCRPVMYRKDLCAIMDITS